MTNVKQWMSWEGGVDLVGMTAAGLPLPNVIVHVARMVHTPVGSAPAGLIFWQPDASAPPVVMGFISSDVKVGAYFGPHIFAGTPFEKAPVLKASIVVETSGDVATAKIVVGEFTFETRLSGLGTAQLIHREPATMSPFYQQGVEAMAGKVELKVNGATVSMTVPPVGIGGGPGAVVSACGVYAR